MTRGGPPASVRPAQIDAAPAACVVSDARRPNIAGGWLARQIVNRVDARSGNELDAHVERTVGRKRTSVSGREHDRML